MESYNDLLARSNRARAEYEAARRRADALLETYMNASRAASEAWEREHGNWDTSVLTTAL